MELKTYFLTGNKRNTVNPQIIYEKSARGV